MRQTRLTESPDYLARREGLRLAGIELMRQGERAAPEEADAADRLAQEAKLLVSHLAAKTE